MISLIRWLTAFLYHRFRWVALGALVRSVTRRTRERSVDAATEELAQRLPMSVVKAADAAPGDLLRHGGRMLATGRQARHLGAATRQVGTASKRLGRLRPGFRQGNWRSTVEALHHDWLRETTLMEREIRADYHRATGDHKSADEIMLDHRDHAVERSPLPDVPTAVPVGRPRRTAQRRRAVKRVQRSYLQVPKPWD